MKKLFVLLVLSVCTMVLSSTAYSLPVSDQDVKLTRPNNDTYGHANGGGEFLINVFADTTENANEHSADDSIGQYISFCVEYSEHISLDTSYNIANVEDYAELGSGGAFTDGKDYLSNKTKWLFWNYLYGSYEQIKRTNDVRANAVQLAIWHYEDEIGGDNLLGQEYYNDAAKDIVSWVDSKFSSDLMASIGDVKVLNLEDSNGDYKQSQIVAAPVPEPATMLLFGTGLVGLAGVARRKKK